MRITSVEIYPARKPSFLANAKVTLLLDDEESITLTDFRILRNKQSELWVAPPNFAVPDGRGWAYENTVILSRKLQFEVSEAVLAAYAKCQQTQTLPSGGAR